MEAQEEGCYHEAKFIDQNGLTRSTRVPVVQDLARRGLRDLPPRFIRATPGQPVVRTPVPNATKLFPPIDVAQLRVRPEAEGRAQELSKLRRVARDWGMFLITNHGIEPSVLMEVEDAVKGFFVLPFAEKKAAVGSYASTDNVGYGRNFVKSHDQPLDWIDRLAMKAAPKGATNGLRVWPQKPANFRQVTEKYVNEARRVCNNLLQALAEALSLDKNAFLKYFDPERSEINVRVNYYPPCPRPDLALGVTPHSDSSGLTFLMQFGNSSATGEGLQVYRDDKWLTVPWPLDMVLVNVGDLLEIMSNGRLKSPWHRVVTSETGERFSVALFYNPPAADEIEPVEEVKGEVIDGGYKKVVVGEYVKHLYEISPTVGKEAILFAKV